MKKSLFLIILATISLSTKVQSQEVDSIRIMSYNIWNGLTEGEEKRGQFIEFMKDMDPEIVGYQELCGFTQEKLEELAKEIGHPYAIIQKTGGYPVGISSKKPITLVEKRTEGYGHGMLHVQSYGLDLIVTHLNPFYVAERQKQAINIINYVQSKNITDNIILMGDMNAHSPSDADYLERVAKTHPERNSGGLNEGNFDYSVIATFLAYPLVDICQRYVEPEHRETYPTLVFATNDEKRMKRFPNRIDFLMISPNLLDSVYNATIHNHGKADYISDHYPISMDICR